MVRRVLVAVGVVALVGLLVALAFNLAVLRQQVGQLQGLVGSLDEQLRSQQARALASYGSPVRLIFLEGLPERPGASGQLLWDSVNRQGVLFADGLAPLGDGVTYRIWAIGERDPVSAAAFTVDADGEATVPIAPLPEGTRVGMVVVTREPVTSLAGPSGPMELLGQFEASTSKRPPR